MTTKEITMISIVSFQQWNIIKNTNINVDTSIQEVLINMTFVSCGDSFIGNIFKVVIDINNIIRYTGIYADNINIIHRKYRKCP